MSAGRSWHPTLAECRFLPGEELSAAWSAAVRRAARAQFPRQTVELRSSAYLAAKLVVADRLKEESAKQHLRRAARKAGLGSQETERAIRDGFLSGQAHALEEQLDGGVRGHSPGAFTAVASARDMYHHDERLFADPGALSPLPTAVFVHYGHQPLTTPVAVAVPRFSGKRIQVDAVFSSGAGDAWTLTRTGRLPAVSTDVRCIEFHRGLNGRLVNGVLLSVDLVDVGMDDEALVTSVVAADKLTPAQRQVQKNLDRYLADARNPSAIDMRASVERSGATAFDALAPVVSPLRAELGRRAVRVVA